MKFRKFEEIVASDNKYEIILADPPWSYKVWSNKGAAGTASSHYDVMDEQSLKESFDLSKITAKNAVLFMWVTFPNLIEGLELINKWGFTYKTCGLTWVKMNKNKPTPFVGMGYYTRANAELCLLATKGKTLPRQSHKVQQVMLEKIGRHSQKPKEAHKRIVELFGDLPRLEMFARDEVEGWDSFGNEL